MRYSNVLLIDTNVNDYQLFVDSVNADTYPIVYSSSTTKDEMMGLLQGFTNIDRIAILNEKYNPFLDSIQLFREESVVFIKTLILQFQVKHLDFLACSTLNDPRWKELFIYLQNETEVVIGASDDDTGNLKYGGDWIMESTNQDIELIYFTTLVEYYKYLLSHSFSNFVVKTDGKLWACGKNNVWQLATGNTTSSYSFINITILQSADFQSRTIAGVFCSAYSTLVLMTDNTLWMGGDINFMVSPHENKFQVIPPFTGALVKQIVSTQQAFILLLDNNQLWACGYSSDGEFGSLVGASTPARITDISGTIKTIASSSYSTCILTTDNKLWVSGTNTNGQLGLGNTTSQYKFVKVNIDTISGKIPLSVACAYNKTAVLMTDGSIWVAGQSFTSSYTQVANTNGYYSGTRKATSMRGGFGNIVAVMNDGTCWGIGSGGMANVDSVTVFTQINTPTDMKNVYCMLNSTAFLGKNSTIYTTGDNANGQLGVSTPSSTTDFITSITDVKAVSDNMIPPPPSTVPSISNVYPLTGTTNTILTIEGTNLSNTSFVKIQGYSTSYTINSSILISALVNASSGNASIVIVNNSGLNTSFSGNFTYQNPAVTTISPLTGTTNTVMSITGTNLGNTSFVRVQGFSVPFTINSSILVTATVNASSGNASVVVIDNVGNNTSFSGNFTYQNPTAISFTPLTGTKNVSVTLTGTNLTNTSNVLFGTANASINLTTPTSLNVSVPANTGNVSVVIRDNLGNNVSMPVNFTYQNPAVTTISPLTGTTNTVMSITGTNLGNTSFVRVQGFSVPFTVNSSVLVTATVNASSGNASVVVIDNVGNNTSFSGNFTYQNPTATSFTPLTGTKNVSVTLTGTNLTNTSNVLFGTANASINLTTPTSLNVSVPANTGNVSVVIRDNLGNNVSMPVNFTYQNPLVTGFTPQMSATNTSMTITGLNLSNTSRVLFGNTNASINLVTGNSVNVSVPASNGNVSIVVIDNVGNNVSAPISFTYQNLRITAIDPMFGSKNTTIQISGEQFENTRFVKMGGLNTIFTINSSVSINASVPVNTGNVSVAMIDNADNEIVYTGLFKYQNLTLSSVNPLYGTTNTSVTLTGTTLTNRAFVKFGNETATINRTTANSINVSVPSNSGNVSISMIDDDGNQIYYPENFTYQNPVVQQISPLFGTKNTSIVLSGTNLMNISSVKIGTTNTSYRINSSVSLNISVPVGINGNASVHLRDNVSNLISYSGNFLYLNTSTISFNPNKGTRNTSVTLSGENLSNTSFVKFGNANASINLITETNINVSVPISSGNVSIVLIDNLGNNVSFPGKFSYENPSVFLMYPTNGPTNSTISLSGENLSNTSFVKFGEVYSTIVSNTSTLIRATVPQNSGNVSVILIDNLGNNTRYSGNFNYQNLSVYSFSPSVGIKNTNVIMTGTSLNNVSYVRFGTFNASIRSKTATSLNVSAPNTTGTLSIFLIDTLGNTFTAPGTFTYQYPTITSILPQEGTTNSVIRITGSALINTKSVKIGNTTITKFISKTSTEINVSILKSSGNVSVVLVDESGLNTSYSGNFTYTNPSITTIVPIVGFPQTPITIRGTNLSNTSFVKFGPTIAPIQSKTNTELVVFAPSTSGRLTITVGDIFKNILSYNVPFVYQTTTITAVFPLSATKNTPLFITGTNLSNVSYVTFGNINTPVQINSSISIQTIVPDSTGSVLLSVVDNNDKKTSYSKRFSFTSTFITSMNASGVPNSNLQITGINLGNTSEVKFDTVNASFKAFNTYINAKIPFGYGNVSVEVIDRYGNSLMAPGSFLYKTPGITQISSDSAPANSTITIYGMNLLNTSFVTFGTNSTTKITKSSNSINVSVPIGYGNVSLLITDIYGNETIFPRNFNYQNTYISSISPQSSPPKSTISIVGDYLSNTSSVVFGTENTSFTIVSNTLINASVPESSGNVSVSVRDNRDLLTTYNELFTYQVITIKEIVPTIGVKNSKITIDGTYFDAVETVKMGDLSVNFTIISNYQMEVVVPDITGTNPLILMDEYNNEVTSTQSFTRKIPIITTVDKVSGLIGETLTIYGTNLGDMKYIVFGNEQGENVTITDTQMTCTIPYGLGEVIVQVSDNYRNSITLPDLFIYIPNVPEPNLVLENSPAFTTIDEYNSIYTSSEMIVNKTKLVNDIPVTEVFYTNTRLISGIAIDKDTLYMCEYESYAIGRYNTKTLVKQSYAIDMNDRVQPNIIKVYKNKLYAICNSDPDTSDPDYLYVFDLSTNALFKNDLLPEFTVQGFAFYNDIIYMSAVVKNSPSLGRVYTTQLNGELIDESAIIGLDNPIDLTFVNDLLAIDGSSVIIYNVNNLTTPLVSYQADPTSQYNSVFQGVDASGNNVIYMTNTTTNTIETVPAPSVISNEILATEITPRYGSQNETVVITGQNFLTSTNSPNIKKVMFQSNEATNLNIISSTLLYCDIPQGSGKSSIRLIDMSDQPIFTTLYFYYQKPTILDCYPRKGREGDTMYIYGNSMNLVARVLIGEIDALFTLLRKDYIRVTVPLGSGSQQPITLIDNLNNTMTDPAFSYNYYVLNSTICFPEGTLVTTDQGPIPIQKLVPGLHTLDKQSIVVITDTYSMDPNLVCIDKDALGKNCPTEKTWISPRHQLYYKGKMEAAYHLVGKEGVSFVPYDGNKLYNVLLKEYSTMKVNGLVCETLHPTNPIVQFFT